MKHFSASKNSAKLKSPKVDATGNTAALPETENVHHNETDLK